MNIELARLSDEQEDVFRGDIGRMLFLMHTGAVKDKLQ